MIEVWEMDNTMTVGQIIDFLSDYDNDMEVKLIQEDDNPITDSVDIQDCLVVSKMNSGEGIAIFVCDEMKPTIINNPFFNSQHQKFDGLKITCMNDSSSEKIPDEIISATM